MQRMLAWVFMFFIGLGSTAEARQSGPRTLDPDSQVSGRLGEGGERLPDGTPFDCYAIETRPGQRVILTLNAEAFNGRLLVARGGQCAGARLQHDSGTASPAGLGFTGAGGRYLVLVRPRGTEGAGPYTLKVEGGAPMQTAAIEARPGDAERLALMNSQVRQREAQLAAEAARRVAEAEQRRLAELERQQQEAEARAERQANAANLFNTFVGTLSSELNNYQVQRAEQQAFLNDVQYQAEEIARQREAAERAERRAREAEQERERTQQRQNAQGLATQLAEANAYRERQMAQATDPGERQRLAAQSAGALDVARQLGVEGDVRNQTQAIMAGSQSSAMMDHADAQQQRRDQLESERRAAEQRQIQQAEARRLAEEQRQVQQAEQRRQEHAREQLAQQAAERAEQQRRRAAAEVQTAYTSAPPIGRLTQDWSQWFTHATHNGVTIAWRARIYDRDSIRVQWRCDNQSGERRYCSISDKTYACYAGNVPAGQGGGIGEASDVAAGRQYAFVSETGCRGTGLTFLLPQARVSATPAL